MNDPSRTENPGDNPAETPAQTIDAFRVHGREVKLVRNGDGGVTLTLRGQAMPLGGVAAAFPLTRPRKLISLRDEDGQEVAILEHAKQLDETSRAVLNEELDRAYFMPRVNDIRAIDEDMNVVEWDVDTDRGERVFQVRNVRRNVRRIGERRMMIKDVDGNRYEIRDWMILPANAQKLLEPYI